MSPRRAHAPCTRVRRGRRTSACGSRSSNDRRKSDRAARGAARAVGNTMARADRPGLPYHRVIAAGGALGGYSDLALKRS
ncbi:MAG: MGMT family protein, partial [Longimicrobiales bacterium]